MKRKAFTIPAGLEGARPLKDGGMSVTFHTKEMPKEEMLELLNYFPSYGWLLFSSDEVDLKDVPKESVRPEYEGKTPAQRLRDRLFVLWKARGSKGDFDAFYRQQMEKILEVISQKIEGEESNG